MKKAILTFILLLTVSSFAENTYMFKSMNVRLREHARNNAKTLATPKDGDRAIINSIEGKWVKVRTTESRKDGWVLKSDILKSVEFGTDIEKVSSENDELKKNISSLKETVNECKTAKRKAESELIGTNKMFTEVQRKYTELREGAAAFADLQEAHDSVLILLDEEKTKVEEMTASIEVIEKNDRKTWFIIGGVLVLISFLMGRTERKGKKKYNYR